MGGKPAPEFTQKTRSSLSPTRKGAEAAGGRAPAGVHQRGEKPGAAQGSWSVCVAPRMGPEEDTESEVNVALKKGTEVGQAA